MEATKYFKISQILLDRKPHHLSEVNVDKKKDAHVFYIVGNILMKNDFILHVNEETIYITPSIQRMVYESIIGYALHEGMKTVYEEGNVLPRNFPWRDLQIIYKAMLELYFAEKNVTIPNLVEILEARKADGDFDETLIKSQLDQVGGLNTIDKFHTGLDLFANDFIKMIKRPYIKPF